MSCCSIFKELLATACRDSFDIISLRFPFVKYFLKVFLKSFFVSVLVFAATLTLYHSVCFLSSTFWKFLEVFLTSFLTLHSVFFVLPRSRVFILYSTISLLSMVFLKFFLYFCRFVYTYKHNLYKSGYTYHRCTNAEADTCLLCSFEPFLYTLFSLRL